MNIVDRFWSRVDRGPSDKCWEWKAGRSKRYGYFFIHPRNQLAHRAAWILTHGEIPEGMVVCHKCDNTFCVNVNHLFLGTQADNVHDMHQKGRGRKATGSSSGNSRLIERDVRQIFDMYEKRYKIDNIAEQFGVHRSTIQSILKGRTWAHLGLNRVVRRRGNI